MISEEVWNAVGKALGSKTLPKWASDVITSSYASALEIAQNSGKTQIHCDLERFDDSYLDFLSEQIQLETRGPEWTVVLQTRRKALSPYVNKDLISLSISREGGYLSIWLHPHTFHLVHWEV